MPRPIRFRILILSALLAIAGLLAAVAPAGDEGIRLPNGYANASTTAGEKPKTYSVVSYGDITAEFPPGPYKNIRGLFLGVSNYKNINGLKNAANDARTFSQTLVEVCGLKEPEVLVDEAVTLANVQRALDVVAAKTEPGDLLVVSFAGHGIALADKQTGEVNGYLALHDAVPVRDMMAGKRDGMLDMKTLVKILSQPQIKAKHVFLALDCCYSGNAVQEVKTRGLDAEALAVDRMLSKRAVFVMSAGDAGQEVFDFSVDTGQNGLLTGYLIQALRRPGDFRRLQLAEYEGRNWVSARDISNQAAYVLPGRAAIALQAMLDSAWLQLYGGKVDAPPIDEWSRRIKPYEGIDQEDAVKFLREIMQLYHQLQTPQERMIQGSGMVMFPLGPAAGKTPPPPPPPTPAPTASPTPRPSPTVTPTAAPVFHTATPTPPPTATPTARPTPYPSSTPVPPPTPGPNGEKPWETWGRLAGEHFKAPEYGNKVKSVLQLIYEGTPPQKPNPGDTISLSADVRARARINKDTWKQVYAHENFTERGLKSADIFKWRDRWRTRNGAGWTVVPQTGGTLSQHYEYSFQLVNTDKEALHYYLVAIDQAGVLQWVSPGNETCKDDKGRNYSSGKSPLAARGDRYVFPEPRADGSTAGNPVMTDLDQYFFLVATRAPWPELEAALNAASKAGCELSLNPANAALVNSPIGGEAKLGVLTRGLGAVEYEEVANDEPATADLDSLTRSNGNLLILTWYIDIVGKDKLVPELVAKK